MNKDSTICFQTSSEVKSMLENIAKEEQQTVASVVEAIVFQYLRSIRGFDGIIQNRRRCDRKKINLKAYIGDPRWQRRDFVEGTIMDISLGGIKFSVPKGTMVEILAVDNAAEYNVIFTLPNNIWNTSVKCRPKRVVKSEAAVQVGAAFVNPDLPTCKTLQKYLI